MSREGALCRARERAQELEDVLGQGAAVELFGLRLVVLFAEPTSRGPLRVAGAKVPSAANAPVGVPPHAV
jgi:hypothetical protein